MCQLLLQTHNVMPYSGKLSKGENFHEFRGSDAICESFLHENGCGPLWFILRIISGLWRIHESFLRKILYFMDSLKFSLAKVSRYTVLFKLTLGCQ